MSGIGEPIQWLGRLTHTVGHGTPVSDRTGNADPLVCLSSVHLPAERRDGTRPPVAAYVCRFARPCGHGSNGRVPLWIEMCVECTAWTRAHPMADRFTECPVRECGEMAPVTLVAVQDINQEAMYG